jgi:catechol 2,3-dioxygenase-like lactoylglutathione lyase family enzyme
MLGHEKPSMNLNQVTVPARNIAESVVFYRKLGLIQIVDSPHYARFECPDGEATFSLHLAGELDLGSTVVIYFEHEDVDALCERMREEGLEFRQMPQDEPWLWREARLKDPSGNSICLYWAGENRKNPPWRIQY